MVVSDFATMRRPDSPIATSLIRTQWPYCWYLGQVDVLPSLICIKFRIRGFARRHYVATCVSVELPRLRIQLGEKPASVFSVSVDLGRFRLGLKGTLDLLIGVRIPASQSSRKIRIYREGGLRELAAEP